MPALDMSDIVVLASIARRAPSRVHSDMARPWLLAVSVVLATHATAEAGYFEDTFAAMMGIDQADIVTVSGFDLPAGSHYQHALLGRYKHGAKKEWQSSEVILLRCTSQQCTGNTVSLGNDEVELLGLVDLATPGALPTTPIRMPRDRWYTSLDKKPVRRAWPALLVRTAKTSKVTTKSYTMKDVTGTERRSELAIVSLVRADVRFPRILREVVDWHGPTGVGISVTFELVRGKGKALDLLATEQRDIDNELACIRPKPTQSTYTLDKNRQYRRVLEPVPGGCH